MCLEAGGVSKVVFHEEQMTYLGEGFTRGD